jgi:hypothetical protein
MSMEGMREREFCARGFSVCGLASDQLQTSVCARAPLFAKCDCLHALWVFFLHLWRLFRVCTCARRVLKIEACALWRRFNAHYVPLGRTSSLLVACPFIPRLCMITFDFWFFWFYFLIISIRLMFLRSCRSLTRSFPGFPARAPPFRLVGIRFPHGLPFKLACW